MKKILKYSMFIWIGILLFGCTVDSYDETGILNLSDVSAGREAEEYGRQMGDNLRYVVTQMNKNGDDFGDLTKVKTAIVKYMSQYTHDKSLSVEDLDNTLHGRRHLTPVQLFFLEKIREAQGKSRTANEFMQSLKEIIGEIQATVPEIQQRNLLKATVALYYLVKETDALLKEGLMPVDLKRPQHIRLRSGGESEGYWAALLAGTCVIASDIGAGLLAALETLAAAAGSCLLVVAGCLLLTGDTEQEGTNAYCQKKFLNCYSPIWDGCAICLQFCQGNGYWPPYSSHKCS
jgi:hypothetical protein